MVKNFEIIAQFQDIELAFSNDLLNQNRKLGYEMMSNMKRKF